MEEKKSKKKRLIGKNVNIVNVRYDVNNSHRKFEIVDSLSNENLNNPSSTQHGDNFTDIIGKNEKKKKKMQNRFLFCNLHSKENIIFSFYRTLREMNTNFDYFK